MIQGVYALVLKHRTMFLVPVDIKYFYRLIANTHNILIPHTHAKIYRWSNNLNRNDRNPNKSLGIFPADLIALQQTKVVPFPNDSDKGKLNEHFAL